MKKDSQLREVIVSTLASSENLPASVITGFWNTATGWKDEDLISDLIRRDDLPKQLVEKAKKLSSIKARTSYLLRASISESEFTELVSAETRAGVLGGVVDELDIKKFASFDKLLIQALANKPTRRLAESVINTETASKELYLQALLAIPNEEQTSEFERNTYKRVAVVAQDENLFQKLLTSNSDQPRLEKWASFALSNKGVGVENRRISLELVLIPVLQDLEEIKKAGNVNVINRRIGNAQNLVRNILEIEDIQPEVVLELRKLILAHSDLNKDFDEVLTALDPVKLLEKEEARRNLVKEISSTSSMDFIISTLNLKSQYSYKREADQELLFAALGNTNLDAKTELALIRVALDVNYDKALEMVKSNPSDDKALEVYKHSYHSMIKEDNYALFSSPTLGRELCIKQSFSADEDDYRSRYSRWNLLEAVVEEVAELDSALGTVPWEFLVEKSSNWYRNQPSTKKVLSYFVKLQSEVLGDDPHKWEALNILSQDFTGSIDDLVKTASTI